MKKKFLYLKLFLLDVLLSGSDNKMKRLTVLLLLSFFFPDAKAQDSLYLVGTITGESNQKRITNVNKIGDVNGDGYADFMIASRTGKTRKDQGVVQLYLGSVTLDLTPNVTFHYACCDSLNNIGNASEIGDVNGDGYDDFTIAGKFGDYGFSKGKVFLYYGGETIDTIPVAEFYEPWIQDGFGGVIEKVGDLNKDSYDDFAIGSSYNWSNGIGYVYLFWGGDTIKWERSTTFTSNILNDFFGKNISNVGDINKDGYEDIAISAPAVLMFEDTAKVYFYFGGKVIDTLKDYILKDGVVYSVGDINGDNNIEFIFYNGKVNIYYSLDSLITFRSYISSLTNDDINNDGYNDFILGYSSYRNSDSLMVGGAFVYFGGETIDTVFAIKLEGENKWGEFSKIMSATDINGDGCDELFILAPGYPDYENPQGKVYIYSYKNLTDVKDNEENLLIDFKLHQNFPNPFNPSTSIQYAISSRQIVTLKVFDILGKEITTLVNEEKSTGNYKNEFNASRLPSGIYFYQLRAGDFVQTKKMILLK